MSPLAQAHKDQLLLTDCCRPTEAAARRLDSHSISITSTIGIFVYLDLADVVEQTASVFLDDLRVQRLVARGSDALDSLQGIVVPVLRRPVLEHIRVQISHALLMGKKVVNRHART